MMQHLPEAATQTCEASGSFSIYIQREITIYETSEIFLVVGLGMLKYSAGFLRTVMRQQRALSLRTPNDPQTKPIKPTYTNSIWFLQHPPRYLDSLTICVPKHLSK